MKINIKDIQVIFICPDSNEKYSKRRIHTIQLLNRLGIKNVKMYKSSTDNYPLCLSKANINILQENLNDTPLLILEDDIEITRWFHEEIEYPEETDAFYLGFSRSGGSKTDNIYDGESIIVKKDWKYIKILNMLTTHAILYVSKRYKQAVIDILSSVNTSYYTDVLISRIQGQYNVYGYYYPFFYQSSALDNSMHVEMFTNFSFNDEKKRIVVTAYYPLKKCKHSMTIYFEWINLFFKSVSCEVICFCAPQVEFLLKKLALDNVKFVSRDFKSFDMMSPEQMNIWNKFYEIDEEKQFHSPELYAVWAAKQEFVREAKKIVDSDIYIWCDIGCFRHQRNCSFKFVENYIMPGKITCLKVPIPSYSNYTIGGGVLAGDKEAWDNFSKLYIEELSKNPHGKDQVIYKRILNNSNAYIINGTYTNGDIWFHLTILFS
jgi:hypothetical protein